MGFVVNSVMIQVSFPGTSASPYNLPHHKCHIHTYSTGKGTISSIKGLNPTLPQELDCVSLSRYTLPGGWGGGSGWAL